MDVMIGGYGSSASISEQYLSKLRPCNVVSVFSLSDSDLLGIDKRTDYR